jgi:peptide-methionine (R)-S-oxide reductase
MKKQIAIALCSISVLSLGAHAAETKAKKETPVQNQKNEKYNPETCAFPKDDASLKSLLSPEQFEITKRNGTEQPFKNAYWDNHHPGLYIDTISKEPLFSSKDKFDSGTGWPSFSKPLKKDLVREKKDKAYGMDRTEVRSTRADSHLGHIFDDGPKDAGGLRYCINSASLKFIPLENLKAEGYEDWLNLFNDKDMAEAKKNPWKSR